MAGGAYLFGYGSLVNPRSLARALGRDAASGYVRGWLRGFARTWGSAERVITADRPDGVLARFLDLERRDGAQVNGLCILITDQEVETLRVRERAYQLLDVGDAARGVPAGARVITFAGAPRTGEVTLREYVRLVEDGFAGFGDDFLAEFRASTPPAPPPIVDGPYRFADPAQNALTTWSDATR